MKKKFWFFTAAMLVFLAACANGTKAEEVPALTDTPAPTATATPEPTSTHTPTPTPTQDPLTIYSIKDEFAKHGLKAGTCFTSQMITDKAQEQVVLSQFNSITMENSMKPDYLFNKSKSIETGDLVVEFSADAIKILDWAKANNMAVRGHTLIWHSQTPQWIFYEDFDEKKPLVSREVMLTRMDSYFKQVFAFLEEKGYADIIYAYDIANECWMEDGSMRVSNWLNTIGPDYLVEAFKCADKYAPEHIDLYYNDYNEQFKTQTFLKFIETLKDENGKRTIDGIGFQAHLYTSDDLTAYFETVDAVSALGIKISLTELDVCLGKYQGYLIAAEVNTKAQGRFYYDLINGLFERIDAGTLKSDSLTLWGYCDKSSWRREGSPCVLNSKLAPKFAYYGVLQIKDKAGFDE